MGPTQSRLDNGAILLTENLPWVKSVTIGFWFRVGVVDEDASNNGIGHFIEHMLFKGTPSRGARSISRDFDRLGGHLNAFSSKEYCCYYARIASNHLRFTVECLGDMICHSLFEAREFERERQVILEELGKCLDTPEEILSDLLFEKSFPSHILGKTVLGSGKTLRALTPALLRRHHRHLYAADRLLVVAVGDIHHPTLAKLLEKYLRPLPRKSPPRPPLVAPRFHSGCYAVEKAELQQVQLVWGMKGIAASSPNRFALHILTTALGGGMSSRLYHQVRERHGLCYTIYNFAMSHDAGGVYAVQWGTSPASVRKSLELVEEVLNEVRSGGLKKSEIARAKSQIAGAFLLGMESPYGRMNRLAMNFLHHGRVIDPQESLADTQRVSDSEIGVLAANVVNPQKSTLVAVAPAAGVTAFRQFAKKIKIINS